VGDQDDETRPVEQTDRKFQFSLRDLFGATAALAICLALLLGSPGIIRVVTILVLIDLLPMLLTVGTVYGRGYMRTFCIGALFPVGPAFVVLAMFKIYYGMAILSAEWEDFWDAVDEVSTGPAILTAVLVGLSVLFGVLAVFFRHLIEACRKKNPAPPPLAPGHGTAHPGTRT
jgi:hypothetical protein